MYASPLLGLMICVSLVGGCSDWDWATVEFYNKSKERIYVTVSGVEPDPSPGVLIPNSPDDVGPVKASKFGDPIMIADTISVVWSQQGSDSTREATFSRTDHGIPAKMKGGTISVTYTSNLEWELQYTR